MITQIDFIDGILRGMIWWIVSALLSLLDVIYGFVNQLLSLDFLNLNDTIWMWFTILIASFTGLFVGFRIIKNYMLDAVDASEDREMRTSVSRLITRIIALELVILLAQPMLSGLSWVSSNLIQNINVFLGSENTTISSVILEANGIEVDESGAWSVTINEKVDDEYVYFNSAIDMVFLVVIVVLGAYQMIFIALSIGDRFVSMLVKLILAPWSISSIVEQNPQSFATWCRLFLADFFANFLTCFLLIAACSAVMGVDLDPLVKCIFLISVLIGIQNAPQIAGHLIGADIGMATGMQSLRTLSSIGHGLSSVSSAVGSFAGTTAAMGVYGIGRAMGGISRHDAQLYSGHDVQATTTNKNALDGIGGGSGGTSGDSSAGGVSILGYGVPSDYGTSSGDYGGSADSSAVTTSSSGSGVTKPVIDKHPQTAYDGTLAHKIGTHQYKNKATALGGAIVNVVGATVYQMAVRRLNQNEYNKYKSYKKDAGRGATRMERRI